MTIDEAIDICESSGCSRSHTYEAKVQAMELIAAEVVRLRQHNALLSAALHKHDADEWRRLNERDARRRVVE